MLPPSKHNECQALMWLRLSSQHGRSKPLADFTARGCESRTFCKSRKESRQQPEPKRRAEMLRPFAGTKISTYGKNKLRGVCFSLHSKYKVERFAKAVDFQDL